MIIEIYDVETLSNLFTYTGYNYKENKYYQFVICDWINEYNQLIEHLYNVNVQVGYNNENFDYPIIHFLINNRKVLTHKDGSTLAQKIYEKAQQLINQKFNTIKDTNKFIPQIDLYKIWHYDNKARSTSLKDLEFAMRIENVEEMPIPHTSWCKNGDEEIVLKYNKNDVYTTYLFFLITLGKTEYPLYKGKNKLEIRQKLSKKFNIPCINYSDVKIGEQLILKLYADKTNQKLWDLNKLPGTERNNIILKDCIPKWANFETKEFNLIKSIFAKTILSDIKQEFNYSIYFHNIKMDYGIGGVHSATDPGIYKADDYWTILDEDVGSLYPSLAINLHLYPEQFSEEFANIYNKDIVSVRLAEKKKPKKERDMVIMEGYKLAANGIYGKSKDENSPIFDPLYSLKTTIAGQMFLSLWSEKLVKAIPEIKFIQHNTDGITYLLPRKDLDKAKKISEEMTKLTGLYIEDNIYSKFILRDVNNYIAVYEDGSLKLKGCFEIDKEFHKDSSMRIVPIALKEYFINNIPVEETIKNHKDIFDFCLRLKVKSGTHAMFGYIENGIYKTKQLTRTTRYFISNYNSNSGCLFKDFGDKESAVNKGFHVTLFNKFIKKDIQNYNINYNFYIKEAYKIINNIKTNQLKLF